MPKDRDLENNGYKPDSIDRGYQPSNPETPPTGDVIGGYVPTTSEGDSPANGNPPGDE